MATKKKAKTPRRNIEEIRDQIRGLDMSIDEMLMEMNELNDLLVSFGEEREETQN